MARLTERQRRQLPDTAFAYVDAKGTRRLPIYDAPHVRAALARFEQVRFENEAARDKARRRLLQAAKKHGIVPVGFMTTQVETERLRLPAALSALPTGTLTLMFTDIEGSTALLHRLGDAYPRLLQKVRRTIRREVVASGGHAVEMRADETFAVFEHPTAALAGAVGVQRSMLRLRWPAGVTVRVRTGLHTGEASLADTGYVGLAVHTAARVSAAAHGGQILVSGECRRAARPGDPALRFRSLGRHRFAGFAEPMEVFQVDAEGLGTDFPPLRRGRSGRR